MAKVFILEDEIYKTPRNQILKVLKKHEVVAATSVPEAKGLYTPRFDWLLLDHDMHGFYDSSDKPNCGYQFVRWVVTLQHPSIPKVYIHSQNGEGRRKMKDYLVKAGWSHVIEHPFAPSYVDVLKELV